MIGRPIIIRVRAGGLGVNTFRISLGPVGDLSNCVLIDKHATRLGAFVAGNDPAPLQHVDQAAGTGVADAQAALKQRNRRGLGLDDALDCALKKRILVGIEFAVAVVVLARLGLGRDEQRLV